MHMTYLIHSIVSTVCFYTLIVITLHIHILGSDLQLYIPQWGFYLKYILIVIVT